MMNLIKSVFACAIVLLFVGVLIDYLCQKRIVEKDYFEKASVHSDHFFQSIKEVKGKPISEELEYSSDGMQRKVLIYSGYRYKTIYYNDNNESGNDVIAIIEISDPAYRIGSQNLGIGSKREDIIQVYKQSKSISDLPNASDLGFIDDNVWIVFNFSNQNLVDQIQIYYGP